RAITITATGYAQPTAGGAKRDAALSLQRAKEVAKILRQLGVKATIVSSGAGRTSVNSASSRYVEIIAKNRK
ncbi:MAG: OmpA family protein, partial [Actinobacteria bacterium]|nr:OmpA family protein [Actinomycetota bacterium]